MFRSDASFPERCLEDAQPMPSNRTVEDDREAFAASFEQDVLHAADVLGWAHVNAIIADAKANH